MTAAMVMIEKADGTIYWECSACKKEIRDKENFEAVTKICPKCGEKITEFLSLYDENGELI